MFVITPVMCKWTAEEVVKNNRRFFQSITAPLYANPRTPSKISFTPVATSNT